jgi:hypothetical protein
MRTAATAVLLMTFTGAADARKGEKGRTPILGWNTCAPQTADGVCPCCTRAV